jgi:glycosyltransferase involved in cell wall biosynthesis
LKAKSPDKQSKCHILFVIDNLQFGGGERVFAQVISRLPQNRYEILLSAHPNEQLPQAVRPRVEFFPLDFSKRHSFSLIPRLSEIIKRNDIKIVHGQGARAEFYARLASRLAGNSKYVSTIAMPVEGFDVGPFRKRIYTLFDRLSERFVDRFLVVSDALREAMIRGHGIPAEKVTRIYNGIEVEHYSPQEENGLREGIRREFNVGEDTIVIGAIGRLVWQKGFDYLISALPELLKRLPRTKILLVGDGPLRGELEVLAEKLKVEEHLIFTGFRSDIRDILSAIDVLVVPSLLEGFPMITLEGMAMAKPIIATRIDGVTEQIVDGVSGILIPSRDPDAIAQAVVRLSTEKELAQILGSEGRRRVENEFTVEKMVSETEKVYQSLYEQP